MRRAVEVRLLEGIQQGKWRTLTGPLSLCYGALLRLRHRLYDWGILAPKYAPLPVVSIGNLVVGGVGKTQVTLLLAEALEDVAILTRGFRGTAEKGKAPLEVVPEQHGAAECGDEPWLLASRLPTVRVLVNRNRYLSSIEAKRRGARIALLDDGMQHRRLFRNVEIVVLGGSDPFGGESFLPKGLLRDDPKRLKGADLVVFVGKPSAAVEQKVAALTEAPCVHMEICVKKVHSLTSTPIAPLDGARVALFCGIGNPSRFVKSVEALGCRVVVSHYMPDHIPIGQKEFERFAALSKEKGAEYLLCTEKDMVKLPQFTQSSPLPLGWVEVELEVVENREAWERMREEIILLAGIKK